MTGLNAVEVPRTEEIEQGADLEHGPDKLRGRQLLSFFAGYVCYTDDDKEELTWRQLCPKLLPLAPVSEEDAGIGEWAHAVTVAAQAPPSRVLEGDMDPQAAGGSINNAGARIVEPPVCRFDISTLQPPLAMAGGVTDVGGSAVDTMTSDDHAVAENFATGDKYGAPMVPAGVAATPTLPKDIAKVAGNDAP
ncbi:hypothetical protein CYMTET_22973, partial [Cymbomonas tetramitiformis]